jgi:hypothetical protein
MKNIKTKFEDFKDDFKDFPFVRTFDKCTIYSKDEIEDWNFRIDKCDYEKYKLKKGKRIGVNDDPIKSDVTIIIVVNKNINYYNSMGGTGLTSDGVIYFEVEKGTLYAPAQEPYDVIPYGFVVYDVDDGEIYEELTKKYKLDYLLISA